MQFPHLQSFQFGLKDPQYLRDHRSKFVSFLKRHPRLKVLKIVSRYIYTRTVRYLMSVEVLPSLESMSLHCRVNTLTNYYDHLILVLTENEMQELIRLRKRRH